MFKCKNNSTGKLVDLVIFSEQTEGKCNIISGFPQSFQNKSISKVIMPQGLPRFEPIKPFFYSALVRSELCEDWYAYSLIFSVQLSKHEYTPSAITIWSSVCSETGFQPVLNQIFRINCIGADSDPSCLDLYKNLELLRFLSFLTRIVLPPPNSTLSLVLDASETSFTFQNLNSLPTYTSSLEFLIKQLDIDTIVSVWSSLVQERSLIIATTDTSLLFSTITGLLSLIFPFKWIHTCITNLAEDNLALLDSHKPFIIGISKTIKDKQTLVADYPMSTILDCDTSRIYNLDASILPFYERAKLKRKLTVIL